MSFAYAAISRFIAYLIRRCNSKAIKYWEVKFGHNKSHEEHSNAHINVLNSMLVDLGRKTE